MVCYQYVLVLGERGKGVGDYDYEETTDENLQMGLTKLFREGSRMMKERKKGLLR